MKRLGTAVALATLLLAPPRGVADELPIFDAHIHYSRPDWSVVPPERALAILAAAGVRRALVSSTPDDGTLRLYEKSPAAIVPFLRPHRTRDDMGGWPRDPAVQAYVEQRLGRGIYRGMATIEDLRIAEQILTHLALPSAPVRADPAQPPPPAASLFADTLA